MEKLSTGWELILNACETSLQIGLTEDENPVCFQQWHMPGHATEILAPALEQIFNISGVAPEQLQRVACVNGPGSFTGIRLVLATAAALRRTGRAKLAQLDYMQALATSLAMELNLIYNSRIYVLTNARRNLVHFQPFISYGWQIPAQPFADAQLLKPEIAKNCIASGPAWLCGSALCLYPDLFTPVLTGEGPGGLPEARVFANLVNPSWEALRLLARHGDYFARDLDPKYLSSCDAVENLDVIAPKQGMEASDARNKLNQFLARDPEDNLEE